MFAKACDFVAGATSIDSLPVPSVPEVAFAGRSNVGKSSLLNALTGRKALARTSQNPGRTRQLNFFLLDEKLMLVDLPGYGYAKASKKEIKTWTTLTRQYLCGRAQLRRACLLLDARRDLTEADREWMQMLDEAAVPYQLVLTKCDKLSPNELEARINVTKEAAASHGAAMPEIIATSSERKTGIDTLRLALAALTEA